ncbi:50S ribosomal protein L18 [Candidatus Parcubacteria bacterium]|nr:50S ribosomal protein L18 [Candidatus Parcubacteria bacterium]
MNTRTQSRDRKRKKIRSKISGTSTRPRLSIFKSNTTIYAQVINDESGVTLAAARGKDAKKVGTELAKHAKVKKIERVVFDRGGYIFTGKVRELAEAAREAGLKF